MAKEFRVSDRSDNLLALFPICFALGDFLLHSLRKQAVSYSLFGVASLLLYCLYYLWRAFEEELRPVYQNRIVRKKKSYVAGHHTFFAVQFADSSSFSDIPEEAYASLEVGDSVYVALTPYTKRVKTITISLAESELNQRRENHTMEQNRLFLRKGMRTLLFLIFVVLLITYGLMTGKMK